MPTTANGAKKPRIFKPEYYKKQLENIKEKVKTVTDKLTSLQKSKVRVENIKKLLLRRKALVQAKNVKALAAFDKKNAAYFGNSRPNLRKVLGLVSRLARREASYTRAIANLNDRAKNYSAKLRISEQRHGRS